LNLRISVGLHRDFFSEAAWQKGSLNRLILNKFSSGKAVASR